MRALLWGLVARAVSRPRVAAWVIARAQCTPYSPIMSRDGTDLYMDRWWLFNPYSKDAEGNAGPARWSWLPSVRVHHILRADSDAHLHDHPWNARTIVLDGWYKEERLAAAVGTPEMMAHVRDVVHRTDGNRFVLWRLAGYTGRVLFGQYHRISEVPPEGVYTLWFTWKYRGTWGFLVNGAKVKWREYLGIQ